MKTTTKTISGVKLDMTVNQLTNLILKATKGVSDYNLTLSVQNGQDGCFMMLDVYSDDDIIDTIYILDHSESLENDIKVLTSLNRVSARLTAYLAPRFDIDYIGVVNV